MESAGLVGVLLPGEVLRRIVRRRATWERAEHYVAAARRFDLDIVLFSLDGYDPAGQRVRGWAPRGAGWGRWRGGLPPLVLNRVIPTTLGMLHLVRWLGRHVEHGLLNPPGPQDSWELWRHLVGGYETWAHTPPSWPVGPDAVEELPHLVEAHGVLSLRSRHPGSDGGALLIEATPGGGRFHAVDGRRRRLLSARGLRRLVERRVASRPQLLQAVVPSALYRRRRFEVRVAVQRDGEGSWRVPAGIAVVAGGGSWGAGGQRGAAFVSPKDTATAAVLPCRDVLDEIFGSVRAWEIWSGVSHLAIAAAEVLAGHLPGLVDCTVAIVVDSMGRPWIRDFDLRETRAAWRRAGDPRVYAELYHNPIAYAHHVLSRAGVSLSEGALYEGVWRG